MSMKWTWEWNRNGHEKYEHDMKLTWNEHENDMHAWKKPINQPTNQAGNHSNQWINDSSPSCFFSELPLVSATSLRAAGSWCDMMLSQFCWLSFLWQDMSVVNWRAKSGNPPQGGSEVHTMTGEAWWLCADIASNVGLRNHSTGNDKELDCDILWLQSPRI